MIRLLFLSAITFSTAVAAVGGELRDGDYYISCHDQFLGIAGGPQGNHAMTCMISRGDGPQKVRIEKVPGKSYYRIGIANKGLWLASPNRSQNDDRPYYHLDNGDDDLHWIPVLRPNGGYYFKSVANNMLLSYNKKQANHPSGALHMWKHEVDDNENQVWKLLR